MARCQCSFEKGGTYCTSSHIVRESKGPEPSQASMESSADEEGTSPVSQEPCKRAAKCRPTMTYRVIAVDEQQPNTGQDHVDSNGQGSSKDLQKQVSHPQIEEMEVEQNLKRNSHQDSR
jgi:hypothetical protein